MERQQHESLRRPGTASTGRSRVVPRHELDDPALRGCRLPEEHRAQRGGLPTEERGPRPLERAVHDDLEAEAVAPEHEAGLDVTRRDRRVVQLRHGGLPEDDGATSLPPRAGYGLALGGSEGRHMEDGAQPLAVVVGGGSGIGAALADALRPRAPRP